MLAKNNAMNKNLTSSGTKWLSIMTYIHPPVSYICLPFLLLDQLPFPICYHLNISVIYFLFFLLFLHLCNFIYLSIYILLLTRRGRDRVVVGYTTTFAISAYHQIKLWVRILPVKLYPLCAFLSFSQFTCTNSCNFSVFAIYVLNHTQFSDLRQVGGVLWVFRFLPLQKSWSPWYNWNIIESGVKHHKPKQTYTI